MSLNSSQSMTSVSRSMPSLRERGGNVAGRHFGVPAVVQVHGQRAQAELLHLVGDIRAVDAAADADDAVVAVALAVAPDPVRPAPSSSRCALGARAHAAGRRRDRSRGSGCRRRRRQTRSPGSVVSITQRVHTRTPGRSGGRRRGVKPATPSPRLQRRHGGAQLGGGRIVDQHGAPRPGEHEQAAGRHGRRAGGDRGRRGPRSSRRRRTRSAESTPRATSRAPARDRSPPSCRRGRSTLRRISPAPRSAIVAA